MTPSYRALIAEDEPLLAQALQQALAQAWPQLLIEKIVGDGRAAREQALLLRPDILFLDIQMPLCSGLEVAFELTDTWQAAQGPLPLLVFVTAYDQYALQAFEAQALDYIVKPVRAERLSQTIIRLKNRLSARDVAATPASLETHLFSIAQQLHQIQESLSAPTQPVPLLSVIQASESSANASRIVMVPIEEVIYFEAADKYIRVLTEKQDYLIRTPLKTLVAQLNPDTFWQVHRGTLVRVSAIAEVQREAAGRFLLRLHQRPERLAVSRLYAHLFKGM